MECLLGQLVLEALALGDVPQVDDHATDCVVVEQVRDQALGMEPAPVAVTDPQLDGLRAPRRQHALQRQPSALAVGVADVIEQRQPGKGAAGGPAPWPPRGLRTARESHDPG